MKKLLTFTLLALCGCAATSTIAPYGKDTYILSMADAMGTKQKAELRVLAAQEASNHCAKLGKQLEVQGAEDKGIAWLTSTSSQIVFKCV